MCGSAILGITIVANETLPTFCRKDCEVKYGQQPHVERENYAREIYHMTVSGSSSTISASPSPSAAPDEFA